MKKERIQAWMDGDLDDDQLTEIEVAWLESEVSAAVSRIVLQRLESHTFPEHKTLQ
jgi:hypothetical protein